MSAFERTGTDNRIILWTWDNVSSDLLGYLNRNLVMLQTRTLRTVHNWSVDSRSGVKVKWSHYRPGVAQRVGRGIALLLHDRDTRMGRVAGRGTSSLLPFRSDNKTSTVLPSVRMTASNRKELSTNLPCSVRLVAPVTQGVLWTYLRHCSVV